MEIAQVGKHMLPTFQSLTRKSRKDLGKSLPEGSATRFNISQHNRDCSMERCKPVEHSQESMDQQWCDISEDNEYDFLISPGDIYPNRKVQLEDADIKLTTKAVFELLCKQQPEAFSNNNKDIGHTQLIEMEIVYQ